MPEKEQQNKFETGQGSTDLLFLVKILSTHKKVILSIVFAAGIISAVIVFFILDPVFFSTGTLKATGKSSGISGLIGGLPDLGDIGNITGELGSSTKELALYENILLSRRCIEETIIKFNLNSEWEFKYEYDAIKNFRENVMEIKKDKLAGTMEIGVYDKNPVRAKEIVDFLIFQLNKINTELNIQNARNNREFIEQRYNLVKQDLKKAEDSLKDFQDINGIAPDIVVKAAAQTMIEIEAEIKSEEVKLELLKKILTPDQAEIKTQEEKINALRKQLFDINNTSTNSSNLSLKGAPQKVLNYLRLERDLEIQNRILTFIIPIYEQSKIEERKETPSLLILDQPYVPDKKAKPKRLTIVLITMLVVFTITYVFFIYWDRWKQFISHAAKNERNVS